jgi:hypothetical protein
LAAGLFDAVVVVADVACEQIEHVFHLWVDRRLRTDLDVDAVLTVGPDIALAVDLEIGIQITELEVVFLRVAAEFNLVVAEIKRAALGGHTEIAPGQRSVGRGGYARDNRHLLDNQLEPSIRLYQ